MNPAIICTQLKYNYLHLAISAFFIHFLHEQSNNLYNSGWGNVIWNFVNKSTARAKILHQSDSTSIIFTSYALKIMDMVLNSFNISVS